MGASEGEIESTAVAHVSTFSHCPHCGQEVSKEEVPVGSTIIEGEEVITKTNMKVSCPEHGTLYNT